MDDNGDKEPSVYSTMNMNNVEVKLSTETGGESGATPIESNQPPLKKSKKLIYEVWDFFTKTGKAADGSQRCVCTGCKHEFKCGGIYGTSHLKRHMSSCNLTSYANVGQMLIDQDGKTRAKKINSFIVREMLAEAVIEHDLPLNFVEYEKVRALMSNINPDVKMPSRNTTASDVRKKYEMEKEKLKASMSKIPNRVCLTSDIWTACTTEGYICLTAHFVDENWKLNSKILNFCRMVPLHSGVELAKMVYDCLKEWGIERKVFSLTLDNASANDNMQENLKVKLCLHDCLLSDGKYFHVRCSAHILNLIVQEGLKVASEALQKIRESVKYVRGSDGRMQKFDECIQEVGEIDTSVGLRLDVPTRWNSTHLMLVSALKYKKVFASLQLVDRAYKSCPTAEEWRRATKICEFLQPFYDTTNLISGSSYLTSNLYFMQVWKIECVLKESLVSEDEVIRDMAQRMIMKFEKYWSEYSEILGFGCILDPRMKLSFLRFCYSKTDPSTAIDKLEDAKRKLIELFEEYVKISSASSSSQSNVTDSMATGGGGGSTTYNDKIFEEFLMFQTQSISTADKTELDLYLEDPQLPLNQFGDLDVMRFWKDNRNRYPVLSIMARDVLSIPITTVASESAFSIGSRVLNKYRSKILHKKVQMLICTRNWLRDFDLEVIDEEEITDDKLAAPMSSRGESNIIIDED